MNRSESQGIEIDGICFQTIMQNYQPVIMVNQECKKNDGQVELGIRITNNTMTPFRFGKFRIMTPEVIRADDKVSPLIYLRRRCCYAQERHFALALPGESINLFIETKVINRTYGQREGELRLSIPFEDGGNNNVDIIKGKKNHFRWIYENQNPTHKVGKKSEFSLNQEKTLEDLWVGKVFTPWLELSFSQ
ncbi:MAG: hypothetical protein J7540_00250 [Roseofilum sp. SID2]|uniref:hypothetical protein n=1 Tax=Roseofilum sp. SID2 TaxID=2821498 RepID=UPI001B1DA12D|nr:hypothetical protein [Roseofilum sp. SID2]MBP0022423.1 hypothetical protein [Roseofilum sp. SID2]